jgi:hypothetical protein
MGRHYAITRALTIGGKEGPLTMLHYEDRNYLAVDPLVRETKAREIDSRWAALCPGQPKPRLSTIKGHLPKIMNNNL